MYYHEVETAVGCHGILWHQNGVDINEMRIVVEKITIPPIQAAVRKKYQEKSDAAIDAIAAIIAGKRSTKKIEAALRICDFTGCTAWQQKVWHCLATEVPTGSVISYGGLAEKLGRPGAARSVGSCMAHNRFPLLIPCHRVVAGGGKLGGFMNGRSDGLSIKRRLLASENVVYIGNSLRNTEAYLG